MRLFLSLDLEEETKKKIWSMLTESQQMFGEKVRWVKKNHWHLTLLFFGEMNPNRVDQLIQKLQPLSKLFVFHCAFDSFGVLPSEKRPRLIYLKALPKEAFQKASRTARKCAARFHFDTRPFLPHLTLARARKGQENVLSEVIRSLLQSTFKIPCTFHSASLMNSTLTSQGPAYERLVLYRFQENHETA